MSCRWFETSWSPCHTVLSLAHWHPTTVRKHDDVIKWKYFPRYWPFVRGIPRSPVNSPHKGQWRGGLIFSFICAWINGWVNNRRVGDWHCNEHCNEMWKVHWNGAVILTKFSSLTAPEVVKTWWYHDVETFPHCWPFARGCPPKGTVISTFEGFLIANLNKLLNNPTSLSCRDAHEATLYWFEIS